MTDEELLANGYHQFEPSEFDSDGIETCFQKCIRDDTGKKYFIIVNKWAILEHPTTHETFGPSYEFMVYLTSKINKCPARILFYAGWSVEEVEANVEQLWNTGLWEYYEKYDEE